MTRQWANNRFACSSIAKFIRLAGKKWPIHFNRRVKTRPTRDFNTHYGLAGTRLALRVNRKLCNQIEGVFQKGLEIPAAIVN